MAKMYNIAERLMNANQKPVVTLDADHEYKINNTAPAMLMVQNITKDEKLEDLEQFEKIITATLGKEAAKHIKSQELTMPALMLIVNTIMAAFADQEIEEVEEEAKAARFHAAKTNK